MKKFFKTILLVACVPFVLTSCDPGTEVKKDAYVQEAAKVEEKEHKEFTTIEVKYEMNSKATGYYKDLMGEDSNVSEKGEIIFTFKSTGWEANKEADAEDVNEEIEKVLNAKASVYYQEMEASYGNQLKYYINPLGLGYESSATQTASGVTTTTKVEARVIFNDYGLLSMCRLDMNTSSKGSYKVGTTTTDVSGEWKVHMKIDLNYK